MFQFTEEEMEDYTLSGSIRIIKEFIQEHIDKDFSDITTINFDNIKPYILRLLELYRDGILHYVDKSEIAEAFDYYFQYRYQREDSPIDYDAISMDEHHSYFLILKFFRYIECVYDLILFPEDVPFFIECLNAPSEKSYETVYKMYDYENQFERKKRAKEAHHRGYFISGNIDDED